MSVSFWVKPKIIGSGTKSARTGRRENQIQSTAAVYHSGRAENKNQKTINANGAATSCVVVLNQQSNE
jgi:hypothetical protein